MDGAEFEIPICEDESMCLHVPLLNIVAQEKKKRIKKTSLAKYCAHISFYDAIICGKLGRKSLALLLSPLFSHNF